MLGNICLLKLNEHFTVNKNVLHILQTSATTGRGVSAVSLNILLSSLTEPFTYAQVLANLNISQGMPPLTE